MSGHVTNTRRGAPAGALTLVGALAFLALVGCTGGSASSPSPSSGTTDGATPAGAASSDAPFSPGPSDVDLPAPSEASTPAASTAGRLSTASFPLPTGWKPVADGGGAEKGYLGNGTPAHARDPRYAAYELMAVGCATVKRSTWTDPTAALEVTLAKGQAKGVADALEFSTAQQASAWFGLWKEQVQACRSGNDPRTTGSGDATSWVGTRSYAGGDSWSETAAVTGSTVRLYALPGTIGTAAQRALLAQLRSAG